MKDLSDLLIYRSEELIERAWERAFSKMQAFSTGSERLDKASADLTRSVFFAGWLACLTAIIESENRKDGIG